MTLMTSDCTVPEHETSNGTRSRSELIADLQTELKRIGNGKKKCRFSKRVCLLVHALARSHRVDKGAIAEICTRSEAWVNDKLLIAGAMPGEFLDVLDQGASGVTENLVKTLYRRLSKETFAALKREVSGQATSVAGEIIVRYAREHSIQHHFDRKSRVEIRRPAVSELTAEAAELLHAANDRIQRIEYELRMGDVSLKDAHHEINRLLTAMNEFCDGAGPVEPLLRAASRAASRGR